MHIRRQGRTETGATLVEYAVVSPVLFLLLFGIVEFGLLTASFTGVWTSAREGARYATTVGESAVSPGTPRYLDCAGIVDAAQRLVVVTTPAESQIEVTYTDPSGAVVADCDPADPTHPDPTAELVVSGSSVEVSVTRSYAAIVPIVGDFVDGVALDATQSRSIHKGVVGADE